MVHFFPNPVFGWAFFLLLIGLLSAAAYLDTKKFFVPKKLMLAMLVCGIAMTLARGALNGAEGVPTSWIDNPTIATGMADAFLFALAGFAVGFGVFFLLWLLGVAGGADVKVMAVLGTWLGPYLVIGALVVSLPVVIVLLLLGPVLGVTRPLAAARAGTKSRKQVMSYTLPLTISVAVLLFFSFHTDLGFPSLFPVNPAAATGK